MENKIKKDIGEFLYGFLSLIFGYPTFEKVLGGEILSQTTGSLKIVLLILFGMIFILGYFALANFICRNFFKINLIDKLNQLWNK
jgi:hypothetical protein